MWIDPSASRFLAELKSLMFLSAEKPFIFSLPLQLVFQSRYCDAVKESDEAVPLGPQPFPFTNALHVIQPLHPFVFVGVRVWLAQKRNRIGATKLGHGQIISWPRQQKPLLDSHISRIRT